MSKEDEIRKHWLLLVIASGARKPKKNNLRFIYEEWCPDGTTDSKYLSENRVELKEILRLSLNGGLEAAGFPYNIVRRKDFKRLRNLVHGDLEPVNEEELQRWSRYNVKGVKKEMWQEVSNDSKRNLKVSLMRFLSFEESINNLKDEMTNWINGYRTDLKDLEDVAEANPDLVRKNHSEYLTLGRRRLTNVKNIKSRLPKLVTDVKTKMRQEVFDAIFSESALSEIPNWAREIDSVIVGESVDLINKCMSLQIETPQNKIDSLLKKLQEIMTGPVEDVLSELSELTDRQWS